MRVEDIEEDTTYVGRDGTYRYVDDFDGSEVICYELTPGPEPAPIRYIRAKAFARWAVGVAPTGMSTDDFIHKLYG